MIKTAILTSDMKPTEEQIAQIEAAKERPIVYDEDSPESTPEMLDAFQRAAVMRNRRKNVSRA